MLKINKKINTLCVCACACVRACVCYSVGGGGISHQKWQRASLSFSVNGSLHLEQNMEKQCCSTF